METQSAASRLPLADQLREARSLLLICGAAFAATAIAGVAYSGLIVATDAAWVANDVDALLPVTVCVELSFLAAVAIVILNLGGVVSARAVIRPWPILAAVILIAAAIVASSAGVVIALLSLAPIALLYGAAWLSCALHDHRVERGTVARRP
ncbi:hypothetical protein [Microbacterium sp. SLBN-146]|uniref:hypothetical protein n=1 Tax=Microbacterium sp. SLBN-146 TaxID=2768457 RepID=UPI0013576F19|nr:hypothetical protein [Microbacterium sp. SLBN-146]